MWRANLGGARLQGADLTVAQLRAFLGRTHLQGARLTKAQLNGAYLADAQLQGADLDSAQLAGANLDGARLEGSDLAGAWLPGAALDGAALQGANLRRAVLWGADLRHARLQGASLHEAELQAANLSGASLQGADLSGADLSNSTFDGTFVFRTSISEANLSDSFIRSVEVGNKSDSSGRGESLAASVDALVTDATRFAREDESAEIGARFARLRPDFQTVDQDAADQEKWRDLEDSSRSRDPAGAEHRKRLAATLGDLACGHDGAPYVARAFVMWGEYRMGALGDQLDGVRKRMRANETCPGVLGFTESDWIKLDSIKPH